MSKKDKKIDDYMHYGDPFFTGPIIKSTDGDEKNKTIGLITKGYKINTFVNKQNIPNYATTVEILVNALNHFYYYNKSYEFESILAETAILIDNRIKDFLLYTDVRYSDTDMDILTNMVSEILIEHFTDELLLKRTKAYVEQYTYYDMDVYEDAVNNYQKSLTYDGIKVSVMLSIILKMLWFVTRRCISKLKISRSTIDVSLLRSRINIVVFEAIVRSCSYIYSVTQPDWDGVTIFDFHEEVIGYFLDRSDKDISENLSFMNRKHAVLGNTEAAILSSVYKAFSDTLNKVKLLFAYKPGIVKDDDIEAYMKKNYYQDYISKNDIYVKDTEAFGYNGSSVIQYIRIAIDNHVQFNSFQRKEKIVTTIADPPKDDEDSGLSRREKILRKDDIINKEQKRINEQITKSFINRLHYDADKLSIIDMNKVNRNILNMTLIPIYLDYMDITIGNPLGYVTTQEYYILLAAVASWDILNKYNTLAEAMLCNKSQEPADVPVFIIQQYCDELFHEDMNKDIIYQTALNIMSTKWTYTAATKHDIEIDVHQLFAFFKDVYDLRTEEDECYGTV